VGEVCRKFPQLRQNFLGTKKTRKLKTTKVCFFLNRQKRLKGSWLLGIVFFLWLCPVRAIIKSSKSFKNFVKSPFALEETSRAEHGASVGNPPLSFINKTRKIKSIIEHTVRQFSFTKDNVKKAGEISIQKENFSNQTRKRKRETVLGDK